MDPNATLQELLAALEARDVERTTELADALLDWLHKRGFPPTTVGPKALGQEWHRAVATFVCHAAKSKARGARKRRERKRGA